MDGPSEKSAEGSGEPAGGLWQRLRTFTRRAWDCTRWLARILWVCRVSSVSAFGGLLLFCIVTQAQNLLADTSWLVSIGGALLFWGGMLLGLLLWAFSVHYAARRSVRADEWILSRELRATLPADQQNAVIAAVRLERASLLDWTPRILGLLPFAAVMIGIGFAHESLFEAQELTSVRHAVIQLAILFTAVGAEAIFFSWAVIRRDAFVQAMKQRIDRQQGRRITGHRVTRFAIWTCLLVTASMFICAYIWPEIITARLPRAALIPLLFGSPVLALSALAHRSHRWAVPTIIVLLGGAAAVTATNVSFNDLRTVPVGKEGVAQRQWDLNDAVRQWRIANGCENRDCVTPVIVAIDGGASRAAFMAATAVGTLLDRLRAVQPSDGRAPGRQIFALSGVSGGALGAAIIQSALAAAGKDGAPPCRREPRVWFGAQTPNGERPFKSWRECLQALVSGDYLSPAFVGIGYRDNFAPPLQWLRESWRIADRAELLSDSWERHWDYVTCGGETPCKASGRSCSESGAEDGFCRRLGYRQHDLLSDTTRWWPVLLLNGTSVATGRRVIASELISTISNGRKNGRDPLYAEAYDLFEFMSARCSEGDTCPAPPTDIDNATNRNGPDLRLASAVTISARFPLISPAGAIFPLDGAGKSQRKRGDAVVDGGYFENSGLSTALDIATALRAQKLQPIVLTISNDPQGASTAWFPPRPAATPGIGETGGYLGRLLGAVTAPLATLYNTRQGHGDEARNTASRSLDDPFACYTSQDDASEFSAKKRPVNLFKVAVHTSTTRKPIEKTPDECVDLEAGKSINMKTVSMSWWLAGPVQATLDAQRCQKDNAKTIDDLIARLRQAEIKATPDCASLQSKQQ